MKRLIIISALFFLILSVKINAAPADFQYGGTALFYSELEPYGTWIELNDGLVVWRPLHLSPGWAPYRYGYWVWTNDGWYWHSDDPFGYIVFHYGRWYYDDYYGWLWVPDDRWAPAWVEWRYDDDYIGWAPLPPYASFSIDFGIHFSLSFATPYYRWHFVRYRYMCDPYGYNYYVPDRIKYRIFSATKYRSNYGYSNGRVINRGVNVDFIRKRSGTRIAERSIDRIDNPGDIRNGRDIGRDAVRAYIVSRDRASADNLRNIDIKKGTRPSSLDVSRIEIGDRNLRRENSNRELNRNQSFDRPAREITPPDNPRNLNTQPSRVQPPQQQMQNGQDRQIKREWNRAPQMNNRDQNRNYNSGENYNRNERRIESSQPQKNNRPEVRREAPTRQAPQVRREAPTRQEPQVRRENRSNERKDSGERKRR